MGDELFEYILCLLYIPLIVIIHEFGHAAFVILFGQEVKEISLGAGEVIFRIKKFVIKKNSWWTGFCAWGNIDSLAMYKKLLIYLGGIIFNLSTATIIWIFGDVQYADWYRAFIFSSYFVALINILPFKFPGSGLESDGLACIQLLSSVKKGD